MSPQQFTQVRDEGKAEASKKAADIGLTKEQMQEALMYMIQVRLSVWGVVWVCGFECVRDQDAGAKLGVVAIPLTLLQFPFEICDM